MLFYIKISFMISISGDEKSKQAIEGYKTFDGSRLKIIGNTKIF